MEKIAKYTRLEPKDRLKRIKTLKQKLCNKTNDWGIEILEGEPVVTAHVIPPPRVRIGDNKEIEVRNGNFTIRGGIKESAVIQNWVVVYTAWGKPDDEFA